MTMLLLLGPCKKHIWEQQSSTKMVNLVFSRDDGSVSRCSPRRPSHTCVQTASGSATSNTAGQHSKDTQQNTPHPRITLSCLEGLPAEAQYFVLPGKSNNFHKIPSKTWTGPHPSLVLAVPPGCRLPGKAWRVPSARAAGLADGSRFSGRSQRVSASPSWAGKWGRCPWKHSRGEQDLDSAPNTCTE